MSAYSDWRNNAITDDEYSAACNREDRSDERFLAEIERQIYSESEDE